MRSAQRLDRVFIAWTILCGSIVAYHTVRATLAGDWTFAIPDAIVFVLLVALAAVMWRHTRRS